MPIRNDPEAIEALENDELILETLGTHIAENYIEGKKKEWDEYRTRVSSWEREKSVRNGLRQTKPNNRELHTPEPAAYRNLPMDW